MGVNLKCEILGAALGLAIAIAFCSFLTFSLKGRESTALAQHIQTEFIDTLSRVDLAFDNVDITKAPADELTDKLNSYIHFQSQVLRAALAQQNRRPIFNTISAEGILSDETAPDFANLMWHDVRTKNLGLFSWNFSPGTGIIDIRRPISRNYEQDGFVYLSLSIASLMGSYFDAFGIPAVLTNTGLVCGFSRSQVTAGTPPCFFSNRDVLVGIGKKWLIDFLGVTLALTLLGALGGYTVRKLIYEPASWLRLLHEALESNDRLATETQVFKQIEMRSPAFSSLISAVKRAQQSRSFTQVAHDLKSPLTALGLIAARTKADTPENTLLKFSLDRINKICDEILNENRRPTKLPVGPLLDQLVSEKKLLWPELTFELTDTPQNPIVAAIDSGEFSRAVSNLLNNAAEHSRINGKIELAMRDLGSLVELEIKDHGSGIDRSFLEFVGKKQFTKRADGLGFGLGTIHAARVVREAGGDVIWTSQSGIGTTVIMRIPKEITT